MGAYFPSDSHPMVYFIIWEMHGFPHKFPTVWENAKNTMVWGKSGKLIPILFPQYGCFSPIRFPSYGILYHIGNAWVSPSISHSTRKYNKAYRMERTDDDLLCSGEVFVRKKKWTSGERTNPKCENEKTKKKMLKPARGIRRPVFNEI